MFLDPDRFPFTKLLGDSWAAIRDEYLALPAELSDPWVQRDMYDGGWTVFGLYALGKPIPAAARCPQTCRVLEQIPTLSMAAFSRLAGGARVKAHTGWAKSVYRVHLGLVVPTGCRFRSGAETRPWQEGGCLVFEDTIEHEAWNESDEARVVLILDVLRPGVAPGTYDHLPEELQQYARHLLGAASKT
jgi:aspartyl/asparaginyl beta-hydroxylase (cupin superfamily)